MDELLNLVVDGVELEAPQGRTILEAADAAGIYIPRLCYLQGLKPHGSCRVCLVYANGRPVAACTTPVAAGMVVENDSARLLEIRRSLIDLLFVEGTHLCMYCEASGRCELQALAYRFGILVPRHPYIYPARGLDATNPELLIDFDRCILCARCVRSSRDVDGKHALDFIRRGFSKRLEADSSAGLGGTRASAADAAARSCPTGALVPKHRGFDIPVGRRPYDRTPIGSPAQPKGVERER